MICILYNEPRSGALADELDILEQVEFVEMHLNKLQSGTYRKGITTNFMAELADLAGNKPGIVFNLVEAIDNKGELLYFVPAILNMHSIPYTGNPLEAMFATTSKAVTARYLLNARLSTPATFLPSECGKMEYGRKYIIKPTWEDGSMDITPESVFIFSPEHAERLRGYSDTHWHIQEFIEGREFNVSVMNGRNGPEVLPPAEMTFVGYDDSRPRIVDYKAKWEEGSFEYINTVRKFPGKDMDPLLEKRIYDLTLNCWKVFGLKGYARVDMRVDKDNIPYVIEVNANPCISRNGGFVAATEAAGYEFTDILKWIMEDLNT